MPTTPRTQLAVQLSKLAHTAEVDRDALRELVHLRDTIEQYIRTAVTKQRTAGVTWQQIGDDVGTSRSAAQQRYGDPR